MATLMTMTTRRLTSAMTTTTTRVDAHQHYWRLARDDYGWLTPALAAIYRDYGPHDLAPLLDHQRIASTVLVQAAATDAETDFLLTLAAAPGSRVSGVVGWSSMTGSAGAERIVDLATTPLLKGVRPMLQDIADPAWILRAECAPAFAALIDNDLCFDALVRTEHLPALLTVAQRYPSLRIVVDHGAKPAIREGTSTTFASWATALQAVARETSAYCKLSGLVTEAGPGWKVTDLRRYVDHLLSTFGPQRLIWGSDWPVLTLQATYAQWVEACETLLAHLSSAEREAIFGSNAALFYRLDV